MSLNVWPNDYALPAGMSRNPDWNTDIQEFDSGLQQAITPWSRPLTQYQIPFRNMNEVKHATIYSFYMGQRGRTLPFLIKDPYDFAVNSRLVVGSGVSAGSLYLTNQYSHFVRADTTTIGSLFSVLSGYVKIGSNYLYDQDTGVFNILVKASGDTWGVRSMGYFKKVRFASDMDEDLTIWNIFNATLKISELP